MISQHLKSIFLGGGGLVTFNKKLCDMSVFGTSEDFHSYRLLYEFWNRLHIQDGKTLMFAWVNEKLPILYWRPGIEL